MKAERLKVALLAALVLAAAVVGTRAVRRVSSLRAADAVCDALRAGDWEAAIASGERVTGTDAAGLRAAECHCAALMTTRRQEECVELLEDRLTRADASWLPPAAFSRLVVEERRDSGRLQEAAELAHAAALRYPEDLALSLHELELRGRLENPGLVLREIRDRLPKAGAAAAELALALADDLIDLKEWSTALEVLGETPPQAAELAHRWYFLAGRALAGLGRVEDVRAIYAAWRQAGGEEAELDALYAVTLSVSQLQEPGTPTGTLLRRAADAAGEIESASVRRALYYRLVSNLVVHGEHQEALGVYDRAIADVGELYGLTREEVVRSGAQKSALSEEADAPAGTLSFEVGSLPGGAVLAVSAIEEEGVDAEYETMAVPSDGRLRVTRRIGTYPERWVLRDTGGRTRGSGTVWPVAGSEVRVEVEPRPPRAASTLPEDSSPGDGRRRVFVVIPDSADWTLIQYGRERGDLPTLDSMARRGYRAVLESDPPFTAAALDAITRPHKQGVGSFFDLLHQIGAEIEGNNFVGRNPFGALSWIVPPDEDLFTVLGAGDLVVANMLRSIGPIDVGRQAEVVGPGGRVRRVGGYRGRRPLSDEERRHFPALSPRGEDLELVQEMASDLDSARTVAAEGEVDLLVLRVAALDILTHRHLADSVRTGQDDGATTLLETYRYLDSRLAQLVQELDGDDILVVASDHGSRTALEHDVRAVFLAAGGGVPTGRAAGQPAVRGLGRMLSDLFAIDTGWPATGIETWVAEMEPLRGGP